MRITDLVMTINGSTAAMHLAALPAPVVLGDSITIEWSRATAVASADPTTMTFQMVRPAWSKMPPPPQDSPITLTGLIPHWSGDETGERETLFRGWIDSVTIHPRERGDDLAGLTRMTVTATCAIGVLARTRIGAPPWPRERPEQRMARIYSIAPHCFHSDPRTWWTDGVMGGGQVVERDVDSTPAMEVLAAAASPDETWLCLDSDSGLVRIAPQPWYALEGPEMFGVPIVHDGLGQWTIPHTTWPLEGADVIPDVDHATAWGTGVATVTVSHHIHGQDGSPAFKATAERSLTLGRTTAPGQAITLASDRVEPSPVQDEAQLTEVAFKPFPSLVDLAQALIAAGADDEPTLNPLTIPLDKTGFSLPLRGALHVGPGRFDAIALPGLELGLPLAWLIMSGTLHLSVTGDQTLEITLAPISQQGVKPVTFSDIARHDMQFGAWDDTTPIYAFATAITVGE